MAEEEKKEEIAGEVGDENVDLNEPETKKLKLDAEVFVELASSPEVPSTTPSKKSRSKVSKEEREAEKARKAEERRIKDEERKREKDRIAEEKRLEKERKDKEREEKKKEELRIKEEKKKAQDEAKEQKKKDEEEKQRQKTLKKKEEEERQDAKRREELEEIKKKQRESQKFLGFFKKLNKEGSDESEAPEEHLKKHKAGAVRAPVHRRATLSVDVDLLTQHAEITTATYLSSAAVKNRKLKCARKDKLKAKLFQFHDNFRPPYYGSWRKKDTGIKPKRPWLPSSQALDYEADSDADWENEPDDGDECKSDEEDPEVDEQQDSDADEFMVEPGYLSDGEGQEESDESNERDAEGRAERLAARASEWKRNVLNKSKLVHECQVQLALFRHATQGIGTAQDGASLRREVETAGRACLKACEAARNCVLPQLRHEGVEFTRNASQFIGCVAAYVVEMKRCVALERTFPAPTEPSITPQMIANMESMLETLENLITVHFSTSESSPTDKVTPRRRRATSCRPQCVCSKLKTSYA